MVSDRPIGICLIGAGRAGMIHAMNYKNRVDGAAMAAVVDPFEEACRTACQTLGIERYYTDYREALTQEDIDAIIVASPTKFHREIVVAAAEAGKHILCEKPMAMNEAECEEMIAAAEKNGVILQLGFMRRFDESFMQAKEAIDSGAIGEIVHIRSLTRGPSKPHEWMYDIEKSNGPLAEVSSHDIDCIRWLAGSELKEIYAVAGNFRNREIADTWPDFYDNVVLTGRFENGVLATIEGAQYVKYGYDARVEVLGTDGVIHIGKQDAYGFTVINKENGIHTPFVTSWTELFKQAYLTEDIHFAGCVRTGKAPKVTGLDGKMAVRIVNAGNRSIKENRIIQL
jgi:myo-inositol 2-dehydrogenase/D-chiro-inositol 1-dehydrogenase